MEWTYHGVEYVWVAWGSVTLNVCHLSTAQAESVARWAAQALLACAVEEANAKPAVKQLRGKGSKAALSAHD